jgi:hypothetical protein
MVISIAYQSVGQSLAKLEVAHRSHQTHAADPTTPPACYAPARGSKLQPRLIRPKITNYRAPAWGENVPATPFIRPQKFMPKSHG